MKGAASPLTDLNELKDEWIYDEIKKRKKCLLSCLGL